MSCNFLFQDLRPPIQEKTRFGPLADEQEGEARIPEAVEKRKSPEKVSCLSSLSFENFSQFSHFFFSQIYTFFNPNSRREMRRPSTSRRMSRRTGASRSRSRKLLEERQVFFHKFFLLHFSKIGFPSTRIIFKNDF